MLLACGSLTGGTRSQPLPASERVDLPGLTALQAKDSAFRVGSTRVPGFLTGVP